MSPCKYSHHFLPNHTTTPHTPHSKELQKMLQSGCARGLNLTSSFLSGKLIILVLIVCVVFGGGMPDAKVGMGREKGIQMGDE